jgi:hypothetical protein
VKSILGETMLPDRINPDSAAEVFKCLVPKEKDRQVCLEFFANSIGIAHALHPERWGVTLKTDLVRLNVGNIEVISLVPEILHCMLDLDTISEELGKNELLDFDVSEHDPEAGFYKSVPKSVACYMLIKDAKRAIPLIEDSHRILVENAAQTRRHAMTKRAHSPGVIDYLSACLSRKVPQPEY